MTLAPQILSFWLFTTHCRGDQGWLTQVMVDIPQISLEIGVLKNLKVLFVIQRVLPWHHMSVTPIIWQASLNISFGPKKYILMFKYLPLFQCCRLHVENQYDENYQFESIDVLLDLIQKSSHSAEIKGLSVKFYFGVGWHTVFGFGWHSTRGWLTQLNYMNSKWRYASANWPYIQI